MRRLLLIVAAVVFVAVVSAQLETLPDWARSLDQPWLVRTFLKLEGWQWIGLAVVALLAGVFGLIVQFAVRRLTDLRDRLAPHPMQAEVRTSIIRCAGIIGGAQFGGLLLDDLDLPVRFQHSIQVVIQALSIAATVVLLYSWWDAACDTLAARTVGNEQAERLLIPLARKWVRAVIVVGGAVWALAYFGGTQTIVTLVGTLGIGGLVVALAAKDSVENLFGSFTIMFDMPFALGDWVKIDKVEGSVEQINLRSTRIRTAEDTLILLPNANLIRASVENYGARRTRRLRQTLRISYATSPIRIEAFRKALVDYLSNREDVLDTPIDITLTEPQEQSIGLLIDCRLTASSQSEEMRVRHELLLEALRLRIIHKISLITPGEPPELPSISE